jgi:tetratricopeptide (TPR) repeat protein
MRRWSVIFHPLLPALLGTIVATAAPAASDLSQLPSEECIRRQRSARIAAMKGDKEGAADLLLRAHDACPQDPLVLVDLIQLSVDAPEKALQVAAWRAELRRQLLDPSVNLPVGTLRLLGRLVDLEPGDYAALLEAFHIRVSQNPEHPGLLQAAFEHERHLGELERAREYLDTLVRIDPQPRWRWDAFLLDVRLERWEDALAFTTEQIASGEASPMVVTSHFDLLTRLGRGDEAYRLIFSEESELARQVRDSARLSSEVLPDFAWALYDAGALVEAEAVWRRVLAEKPDDERARRVIYYLFSGEAEREEIGGAIERFASEELDPYALLDRGAGLLAAGDDAAAFEVLAEVVTLLPQLEAVWFNYGLAAFRLQRWREAADAYLQAAALNPGRSETQSYLALALASAGDCAAALPFFERAIALAPRRDLYYYQSTCLSELGHAAEAAEAMSRYRALVDQNF